MKVINQTRSFKMDYIKNYEVKIEEYNKLQAQIERDEKRLEDVNDNALLLENSLKLDKRDKKYFFEFAEIDISNAAKNNDIEVVKFLFDRVSKDARYNSLDRAVNYNNMEIVKFLLEKGLNPFLKRLDKMTHQKASAYQIAKTFEKLEFIKLFEKTK
jgi:ankyrin repeat protein